jgi:hypothetical protein
MNFPVAELKKRYSIGKQTDINRRKHLNITPQKVDGVMVVDDDQLTLLDKLDHFLKNTPNAKMSDFTLESTESTRPAIMEALLVNDETTDLAVRDEEHTDLAFLVETIAKAITPPNPIAHWERLQWLVDNEIIISTAEVYQLVGTKPKGNRWKRGSFVFEKTGKLGTQTAWRVYKNTK